MVFGGPDLGHGSLEFERLQNHAGSLRAPGCVKPALAMIVQLTVVENILGSDGYAGWNDLVLGRPGRLNRDVLHASAKLELLRIVGPVRQVNDSHFMIDSRPRIVPEIRTHHETKGNFLKPLGEMARCLDPDFELSGLGPTFHSDCFPADPRPLVDAYLGLGQPSFAGFPMFPL